jgi:dimeric dUTPase (all-alpha-NTP-PPase superfamily)
MNLQKLFELQRKLDEHIEQQHPRQEGEDRLAKKILALQVELGELANELPEVFKYWSNKKNNYEKALKEYVDGLHFILSIGLEIRFVNKSMNCFYGRDLVKAFNTTFYLVSKFCEFYIRYGKGCGLSDMYEEVLWYFLGLGKALGFTWEQIEEAYMKKNAVNHQRQESGY